MEHTPILPLQTSPEAFPLAGLPEGVEGALALHGLSELLFAPIPKVARALAGFDRNQLGAAIEVMIALLDASDPDPDMEDDDPEGQRDEDGINTIGQGLQTREAAFQGPGCPISDPGEHNGRTPGFHRQADSSRSTQMWGV